MNPGQYMVDMGQILVISYHGGPMLFPFGYKPIIPDFQEEKRGGGG